MTATTFCTNAPSSVLSLVTRWRHCLQIVRTVAVSCKQRSFEMLAIQTLQATNDKCYTHIPLHACLLTFTYLLAQQLSTKSIKQSSVVAYSALYVYHTEIFLILQE